MSIAKLGNYDKLYEWLGTKKKGKYVFRLAKGRKIQYRDFKIFGDYDKRVFISGKK